MKSTFLVKKDPNIDGKDNWIIMSGKEFYKWKKTPEGEKRKDNFGVFQACSEDDYMIYMECDDVSRKAIRKTADRQRRVRNSFEEAGFELISYDVLRSADDTVGGDEIIGDDSVNVEDEVMRRLDNEFLEQAVSSLPDIYQHVIRCIYLSNNPMTEAEYGALVGISQSAVSKRKLVALEKLKKFFLENGGKN